LIRGASVLLIQYAELTWPEVPKLPRHLPVLIPLGRDEYDCAAIIRQLAAEGHLGGTKPRPDGTDRVVVLPSIPYGFGRADGDPSGQLHIRPGLLRRVLLGVQRELKAQEFEQIFFLNGHGGQGLNTNGLKVIDVPYRRKVGIDFPPNLSDRVTIISTGHTEQHGYHLPLSTDSLIVEAIARGVNASVPADVFCLPVWPYGVSTHTREFPGTLNLGGRVFEDFFLEIVDRLVGLGAEMIYFSNGHGGNHSFLVNVVKYAGERHPGAFIATEWLHTTGSALERFRQSTRGGMGHGGELETSYVLHLRPDLVHMDRATTETEFISTPNYTMDWVEGGKLTANPAWSDDTTSGIYGDGRLGTAEKGLLWLASAIEEKLDILQEIREQHVRRQMKRAMRKEKFSLEKRKKQKSTA
jgi:creatinine amidohydrolase